MEKLDPEEETKFQEWYAGHAKRLKLNPDPDNPLHFYDYRAAYKAGEGPGANNHWPSSHKLKGHPRMVVDGINTKTGERVNGAYKRYKKIVDGGPGL